MYRRLIFVVALLAMAGIGAAGWFLLRPTMRATFHVVAADGAPVAGTSIAVWTFHSSPGGDRSTARAVRVTTDDKGLATVTLASRKKQLGYRVNRPDHPGVASREYVFEKARWGRRLPWDPTIEVTLPANQKPIPMYAKEVGPAPADVLPVTGRRVGYDLMAGDWLAPYGRGTVADFLFTYTEIQKYQSDEQPFEVSLILAFSNKADGIQAASAPAASGLRDLHKAPLDGYSAQLRKLIKKQAGRPIESDQPRPSYYFRIRTELDETGQIKSALYGKIEGDLQFTPSAPGRLQFKYSLNPTPNDRNVQFDPEQNLFTKSAGQGTAATPAPTPSGAETAPASETPAIKTTPGP